MTETTDTWVGVKLTREVCDARLLDALLYATHHPHQHRQSSWGVTDTPDWGGFMGSDDDWPSCGTAACLFGTAVIRAGLAEPGRCYTPLRREPRYWVQINSRGEQLLADHGHEPWDDGLSFIELGALLFGLDRRTARRLSDAGNTLAELWTIARLATEGRVTLPAELVDAVNDRQLALVAEDFGPYESY